MNFSFCGVILQNCFPPCVPLVIWPLTKLSGETAVSWKATLLLSTIVHVSDCVPSFGLAQNNFSYINPFLEADGKSLSWKWYIWFIFCPLSVCSPSTLVASCIAAVRLFLQCLSEMNQVSASKPSTTTLLYFYIGDLVVTNTSAKSFFILFWNMFAILKLRN